MTDGKDLPLIFDEALLTLRRARAARRSASFLLKRVMEDAAERLQDVNRQFQNGLILGSPEIEAYLRGHLPQEKCPAQIKTIAEMSDMPNAGDYDLILSLLTLQSENDLVGTLIRLRTALKPDGLFIAAMFGGDTLIELRQALYQTDEALLGGMSARVYPLVSYTQAGALLSRAGLNQPVVDTDRFTVSYGALEKLISDLRDLGETNVLIARNKSALPKPYSQTLKKNYHDGFAREDSKLKASFEILWLTGWSPHESQQKPLKPGSAKMRLAEALGANKKNV